MNGLFKFSFACILLSISAVVFLAGLGQVASQKYQPVAIATTSVTPVPTYPDSGLDVDMLEGLKTVKKGIVSAATVSIFYKGTIIDVAETPAQPGDPQTYNFKITLRGEEGAENSFTYSSISMGKIQIYDETGSEKRIITRNDLKAGDVIEIENVLNIYHTRKDMLVKGSISKISHN